jgi:hypothetical protein
VCCIAPDDAVSDQEGFLNVQRLPEIAIAFLITQYRWETGEPYKIYLGTDIAHWSSRINYCQPLSCRGWTLQEEVLAPRTLHYTSKQLIWDCQRQTVYESSLNPEKWPTNSSFNISVKRYFLVPGFGRNQILSTEFPKWVDSLDLGRRWYSLLLNYTKRSLTFQSDRLAAIAGLAQEIHAQTGFTYQAGIWVEDAHLGLLWKMY